MAEISDFRYEGKMSWCPGCGDFQILKSLEIAAVKSGKQPNEMIVVSGIGQAAKLPHYIKTNGFNSLHGRALSSAFGLKAANHNLTVVVATGDGDCYGEGGNHFIHNLRRNIDITVIVHNNQIYGLTKGQASPTSEIGMVTAVQPKGVVSTPFRPLAVAVTHDAAFVARSFSKEIDFTANLILQGMNTPGFSLIDVLQPCVSFNKINTYKWYQERAYHLDDSHDPTDKQAAYEKAMEWGEKIPLGVLFRHSRKTFLDYFIDPDGPPLAKREVRLKDIELLLEEFY